MGHLPRYHSPWFVGWALIDSMCSIALEKKENGILGGDHDVVHISFEVEVVGSFVLSTVGFFYVSSEFGAFVGVVMV